MRWKPSYLNGPRTAWPKHFPNRSDDGVGQLKRASESYPVQPCRAALLGQKRWKTATRPRIVQRSSLVCEGRKMRPRCRRVCVASSAHAPKLRCKLQKSVDVVTSVLEHVGQPGLHFFLKPRNKQPTREHSKTQNHAVFLGMPEHLTKTLHVKNTWITRLTMGSNNRLRCTFSWYLGTYLTHCKVLIDFKHLPDLLFPLVVLLLKHCIDTRSADNGSPILQPSAWQPQTIGKSTTRT